VAAASAALVAPAFIASSVSPSTATGCRPVAVGLAQVQVPHDPQQPRADPVLLQLERVARAEGT
jgi:hypothetical protein